MGELHERVREVLGVELERPPEIDMPWLVDQFLGRLLYDSAERQRRYTLEVERALGAALDRIAAGCPVCAARNRQMPSVVGAYVPPTPNMRCSKCGQPTGMTFDGIGTCCYGKPN